jgi:arabinogalactan oligomer/maltooligosaccharide transport system permease protein
METGPLTKAEKAEAKAALKALPKKKFNLLRWFLATGWKHLVGVVVVIYAIFPIVYILSGSLNPDNTLTSGNKLFPGFTLDHYFALFNDPLRPYGAWFVNTIYISTVSSIGTVFLSALAAYAFSRMRFFGRRGGLLTLILVQMFPQMLGIVAIYSLLAEIGKIFPAIGSGTQLGLIMVYLGGALGANTYLMYGFFNTIPKELDEAAKIDGATHTQIFYGMILRLTAPILAVIALLSYIGTSSDFMLASIILVKPEDKTLAVGLYNYISDKLDQQWTTFAAGAILAAIPIVALFLWLQRYIVSGLTGGAVKG